MILVGGQFSVQPSDFSFQLTYFTFEGIACCTLFICLKKKKKEEKTRKISFHNYFLIESSRQKCSF